MQINDVIFNIDLEQILQDLSSATPNYFQKGFRDNGEYVMCQCPFHKNGQERKMSAGIRKDNGIFHCFTCGEVHSLPEVITYCFSEDDILGKFGWNWLLRHYVSIGVEERGDISLDFARNGVHGDHFKRNRINSSSDNFVSEEELESYRYIHPYMYERGLTDEIIEIFDIGYDTTNKTITFPIKDIKGNCLYIARRSVVMKWYNYPKGVEKPLYGLYELYQLDKFPDEVYICESMIDALTIWCYNKYAVALNGLGNELSIAQIKKLPCRKVILATDKDDAGKKARIRLRKELNNKIVTELDYRTYPDHAKDINDMTREEFYALGEVF